MTDRELMQQALEMIEDARNGSQRKPSEPVITALRERLAQPECNHEDRITMLACVKCGALVGTQPEQEPEQEFQQYSLQSDRMRIDPVTGDVGIGTPKQEPLAIDGAVDRLLINIRQPEAYISFGWTYQPDMWAHVDKDNNVTHLDMGLCAEGPRNAHTALAIAIWNKAIEAAASKAYGVGDEGMYAQIMELKK